MRDVCIVIPAVKKNVAFPNDLTKKLNGTPLVQRVIERAKKLVESSSICVVTDSEHISLICERNEIEYSYDKYLKLSDEDIIGDLSFLLPGLAKKYKVIMLLLPYAPLLSEETIYSAMEYFKEKSCDALVTIKEINHRIYKGERLELKDIAAVPGNSEANKNYMQFNAFLILDSRIVENRGGDINVCPFLIAGKESVEITSYRDWWICEKLLKRKRIVFRVIGSDRVGMGHIYRTLTLAHEITDHEIIFICDTESRMAVNQIAGLDYLVEITEPQGVTDRIIALEPDLVINDILSTEEEYIQRLKKEDIMVVNFEDMGGGAAFSDLTINELFDEPQFEGENIRWGHEYYFLRDEFVDARAHRFKDKVDTLLITFGGTDQNDFTLKMLKAVKDICTESGVRIQIVSGPGYLYKERLKEYIDSNQDLDIDFTYATGVMSGVMEKAQIAVTSNGRTVYELAHMNIPAIVIAHHERERTHTFSNEDNGFLNLGCYEEGRTEKELVRALIRMIGDNNYRRELFDRTKKYNFSRNKEKVVRLISGLID